MIRQQDRQITVILDLGGSIERRYVAETITGDDCPIPVVMDLPNYHRNRLYFSTRRLMPEDVPRYIYLRAYRATLTAQMTSTTFVQDLKDQLAPRVGSLVTSLDLIPPVLSQEA